MVAPSLDARRFLLPVVASALLVASAPFLGLIRYRLQQAFPGDFIWIVAAIVAAGALAALVSAVARIRDRRLLRYGTVAVALVIAAVYSWLNAGENQDSNVVELLHFLQYGAVTLLFYRACRDAGDASVLAVPLLAGLIVGTAEEWLQWFLPVRVGEIRDLYLNLTAIVCGLLFSLAIDPPRSLRPRLSDGSSRVVAAFSLAALLALAAFIHAVHLGYEIRDPEAGVFESRYSAAQLASLQSDRARQWRSDPPPLQVRRVSREDQYMTEGVQHVRWRNRQWAEGDALAAWNENLILERYFAPVLDTPSPFSSTGHRWPDAQRDDAGRRASIERQTRQGEIYFSGAFPYPIFTWPAAVHWSIAGIAWLVVLLLFRRPLRRTAPGGDTF